MLRIEPTLPMLRIEPVLPMLRIEPALPMLRIDPALPMLNTLPMLSMLPTLPKLKMLNRLLALNGPARLPAPARDLFFERAALCMTASSLPGPYASSSQSSSIAGDLTPPERLAL
jgi:hypothetical protein